MATRKRFEGSGREKEGGFLTTHKQDFIVHTKGTDWRHSADQVDMNPIVPLFNSATTVQGAFEEISTLLQITNDCFVSIGDGYARGNFNVGDPGVPDLETAISLALSLPNVQEGGTILIKPGTYTLTTTVEIPAGINLLGDPTGTIIIGEMTEQPMFKLLRASDRFSVGPSENMAVQKSQTRIWNLTLFDNLFGNAAAGSPSMITTEMIQCQRGSNVLIENCTIIGKAVDNPSVFVTGRGIGFVDASNSQPTTLQVDNCIFDAQRVSIDYNNSEGAPNTLRVENSRSRTFGDGGLIDADERCFILFGLCNAQFNNNFHIGLNDTWSAESCFRIADIAVADINVRVVISGNTGQIQGAVVDVLNQSNFLIDSRSIKTAYKSVLLGNNWGFTYNSQFYYTVGDGTSSVGDITGTNAIDIALLKTNNETIVYVLPGTYELVGQGNPGTSANLIGVSSGTSPTSKPIIELNLGVLQLDAFGRRATNFSSGKLQNITFRPHNSATTFQSIICGSASECNISNCNFEDLGLVITNMNGTVDNCLFNQGTAFPDNLGLSATLIGDVANFTNNTFLGRGYALRIIGAPSSGTVINVNNNIFDEYRALVPELPGVRISVVAPAPALSYYIQINGFDSVNFRNNFIKGFNTTGTLDTPVLPALLISGTFDRYVSITGMNLYIENNEIYGPNQTFDSGGTDHTLPTLYLEPTNSCYIIDSKVTGALPIQVSGNAYSLVNSADPRVNGGILQISRNQLKGYPENGANVCGTVIDLDLPRVPLTLGTNSINHAEISDNTIDQGRLGIWNTARHFNVTGGDYDVIGTVQTYGENWLFNITDNSIVSRMPAALPVGFVNGASVIVDNQISATDPAELRARAAPIFKGNTVSVNTTINVGVGDSYFIHLMRAEKSRVNDNLYTLSDSTGFSSGGDYGYLRLESVSLGSVISGNSFDAGVSVPGFGAGGAISLVGGGGIFNDNAFTSPFRIANDPVDMINPDNDNWHIGFDNAGTRNSLDIRYLEGQILNNNLVTSTTAFTVDTTLLLGNLFGYTITTPGAVTNEVASFRVDLSSILPKGSKLVMATVSFTTLVANIVGTELSLTAFRKIGVSDLVIATDSVISPGASGTLTIGSQAASIDTVIDDMLIDLEADIVSSGATTMVFSSMTIWFEVG